MITKSLCLGLILIPLLLLHAQQFNESDIDDGSQHVKQLLDPETLARNESVIVVSFLSAISQIPEEVGDLLRVFSQSRQVSSSGDSSSTFESKHASTVGNLHSCFRTDFDGSMIAGALKVAVDDINERNDILPNHVLHYIFKNTCGDEQISTQAFMDHWKMGARVFIGPESNCRTEAQMAAAQNLPIISYKCRDKMVSDKKKYMTFSRTAPAETDITRAFVTMMKEFKWHKFSVIYESTTQANRELMEALRDAVEMENKKAFDDDGSKYVIQNISDLHQFSEINEKFDSTLEQIIDQTKKITRVYVTFGSVRLFRRILQIMGEKGMMNTQEFMLIYLDPDYNWLDPYHAMNNHFVRNTMVELLTSWDGANSTDKYSIPYLKNALAIIPTPVDYTSDKFVKFWNRSTQYLNYFGVYKDRDQRWSVRYNRFACYLYDAMMLYAKGLHQLMDVIDSTRKYDPTRDGIEITKRITGTYESICGFTMTINENHDAKGNYTLLSWQTVPSRTDKTSPDYYPFNHALDVTGVFIEGENGIPQIRFNRPMQWTDGVPKDQPECGFNDELCAGASVPIAYATFFLVCGFTIVGIGLGGYCSIKNKNVEKELHSIWMLDSNEITNYTKEPTGSLLNLFAESREFMDGSEPDMRQLRDTGLYKGQNIWIKELTYQDKKQKVFSRKLKIEMRTMRQLNCANVNCFLGIFMRQQSVCVVREYAPRGSLMDILQNKELKLDKVFVASFLDDLIKGMAYIHDTDLGYHGNLKSTNCLITSRWVLQVADFGVGELREGRVWHTERARWDSLLWTAPEILRESQFGTAPFKPTKAADAYSFGVILHEMLYRNGPYGCMVQSTAEELSVMEIIKMAAEDVHPHIGHAVYISPSLAETMKRCFSCPSERPDFRCSIRTTLRAHLNEQKKKNIMDHMLDMMDKYQETLEETIKERAAELREEQQRSEKLLERMLPAAVANQLLQGVAVEPEAYPAVTIYFSDIVGFTRISGESDPIDVVKFLNKLYTLFDAIIQQYCVYKVETIGDAYMVVSGVPTFSNKRIHAEQISVMALHLLKAVQNFTIPHVPKEKLLLRIGVHTGPCVGGIVGTTMPRFCLFGDTVNTASRMESNGEPLKIHISEETKLTLDETKGEEFIVEKRGTLLIKGKGEMTTYFLTGRKGLVFEEIADPTITSNEILPAPGIFPRSSAVKTNKFGSLWGINRESTLSLVKDFTFMRKHDKPASNPRTEFPFIDSTVASFSSKNGGIVSVGSSCTALASVNEEESPDRSRDRRKRPFAKSSKHREPVIETEAVLRKRSTSLPDGETLALILEDVAQNTKKQLEPVPPAKFSVHSLASCSPSPSQYPSYRDLHAEVQRKRGMTLTVWPSRKRSLSVGDSLPDSEPPISCLDTQLLLEDKRKPRRVKDRKSVLSLHGNFLRDVSPLTRIRDASPFGGGRRRNFWKNSTGSLTSSNCSSELESSSLDVVVLDRSRGESIQSIMRRLRITSSDYTGLTDTSDGSDERETQESSESFVFLPSTDCPKEPLLSKPELMV